MECMSCGKNVKWIDDYDEFCMNCLEVDLTPSGYEWTCPKCKTEFLGMNGPNGPEWLCKYPSNNCPVIEG